MTSESNYINKHISNYYIIRQLGSGASGRVYLAQHTLLTKRTVAIKLLHATHLSSPEECRDFLREAQILEELKHPYILPIVDVGIEDGFPYIVAEYASNGSLRDRIKSCAPSLLPLHEIVTILTQIGQALSHAHQRHIIHRDIKPENILFNAKNEALLADFGLATSLSTASVKYVDNAGTPRYMSPEQFQGHVSKESDQYSLACIAYELVTGHQPFIEKDFYALGFKHLTENPIPPTQLNPYLPVALEQVILKAMAKQRANRYPDISSFIGAFVQATRLQPYPPLPSQTQIPTLPSSNMKENSQDSTLLQIRRVDQTPAIIHHIPITPLPPIQEAELLSSHSNSARKTLRVDFDEPVTSRSRGQADRQRTADMDDHASTNAPFLRSADHLTGSSPSSGVKRGSSIRQQWLMVGVVCLVVAASILGGFLLVLPSVLSSRSSPTGHGVLPRSTVVTPGKTATEKQPVAKHSTPTGKSPGQSPLGSGSQTKLNSTPQAGPTLQPIPTSQPTLGPTPFPTPTPQPTSPPTPTPTPTAQRGTSETLTVSFLNSGTQTVNNYSGTVTVTVSGAGGVSPKGISDAFYMYKDFYGNPLNPPQHASCWVMDINGAPSQDFVPIPQYNTSYWYQFTMYAPGGPLNFSICDHNRADNHGTLTVTITQD